MRDLFLTSTRPKHRYRSEKVFLNYFKLRHQSIFGSLDGKQDSVFKKMLMLKKFFRWYYKIPTIRFFEKFFHVSWQRQRVNFRTLLAFFHILENNILVLLIRSGFTSTILESLALVRSQFVYVNGNVVSLPFSVLRNGDLVEIMRWQSFSVLMRRSPLFFSTFLQRYRLNYVIANVFLFFTQWKRPVRKQGRQYNSCLMYLINVK